MSWNSWFFCWTKVFPFSFPHQPQIKRRLKMRPVVLLSSNLFVCPPATSKNSEGSLEKCIEDARGISLNYWKNILKCKMLLFGKDSSHISCLSQFQFSKMGSKGRQPFDQFSPFEFCIKAISHYKESRQYATLEISNFSPGGHHLS